MSLCPGLSLGSASCLVWVCPGRFSFRVFWLYFLCSFFDDVGQEGDPEALAAAAPAKSDNDSTAAGGAA